MMDLLETHHNVWPKEKSNFPLTHHEIANFIILLLPRWHKHCVAFSLSRCKLKSFPSQSRHFVFSACKLFEGTAFNLRLCFPLRLIIIIIVIRRMKSKGKWKKTRDFLFICMLIMFFLPSPLHSFSLIFMLHSKCFNFVLCNLFNSFPFLVVSLPWSLDSKVFNFPLNRASESPRKSRENWKRE